jgi:hypothetical protein
VVAREIAGSAQQDSSLSGSAGHARFEPIGVLMLASYGIPHAALLPPPRSLDLVAA